MLCYGTGVTLMLLSYGTDVSLMLLLWHWYETQGNLGPRISIQIQGDLQSDQGLVYKPKEIYSLTKD